MRRSFWLAVVLVALLGAMATKSLLVQVPPVRAHNASNQFDAARAKARLAFVLGDQRPHPTDTAADDQVRARLVGSLSGMGLTPIVRDQIACNELYKQRGVSCARVRNVLAIIGPPTGKALLLNAHYDSTPVGPAAADDGAGVATLLEVASILKDRPVKRPVIVLFNEGEELGLVGARAFLADPLSRNVDSLINLEARGVRGPVNMFETSRPNAAPIAVFAAAVKHPVANSLSTDVYRLMPNYTDVNSFSERGWLTLNLAPIGNETRYHSPGDDLAALDPATLQHMGDQTLALTEALASGAPKAGGGERIFMDIGGRALIALPLAAGAALLAGLLLAFAAISRARGGAVRGIAVVVGTLLLSAALSWLVLALIGAVRPGMFWRAQPLWTHVATSASAMLVAAVLLATAGRGIETRQLRAAFWLAYLILGGVIGIIAPGGIIFFLFPPLLALIGTCASRWWRPAGLAGSITAILFLYLTWGAMLGLLEELLGSGPMWAFAPLGALIILPVLIEAKPLIDQARLRAASLLAGGLALAGWAAAAAAPAYSADRQQRFVIEHVTDAQSGKASWSVLNGGVPLPEAYRTGARWTWGKLPYAEPKRWLAPAPAAPDSKAPSVEVLEARRNGAERSLTIRLRSNGANRISLVAPQDARIRSAGVEGFVRPIDSAAEDGKYIVSCSGRSCDGMTLEIRTGSTKPFDLILAGVRSGLPPSAGPLIAARPKFARPQYAPDQTIAFTRVKL
ncbi:MAG TPA: M28 family peptidase [Sphingomicrobium sp.]